MYSYLIHGHFELPREEKSKFEPPSVKNNQYGKKNDSLLFFAKFLTPKFHFEISWVVRIYICAYLVITKKSQICILHFPGSTLWSWYCLWLHHTHWSKVNNEKNGKGVLQHNNGSPTLWHESSRNEHHWLSDRR